jgi:hypothetical protein
MQFKKNWRREGEILHVAVVMKGKIWLAGGYGV